MPPVRSSRVLVAGALTFAAIFLAVLWADPWGESVSGRVDDITELVVIGLTAAACGHRARRSQVGSRRTWILLAAFAGLWVIGSAIWLVSDLTGSTLPYPSVADVAFLLAVPAGAAALLCFPSPATATSRIRTLLDAAVMAGSLLFVSWAVLLGPVVRISSSANAALAVAIAYPVGDVIILALAMHLLARAGRHRTIVLTLSAGIAAIAISDSAYAWVSTFHPAASGDLTGAGWVLGFLLIAVAAVMAPSDLRGAAASQQARPASPMVIYGCVLVSVGVAAAELLNGRGFDMTLGWIEIAIWLLLVARQWLSSLEVAERQKELHELAFHDVLTGLPNRAFLANRLMASFDASAERRSRAESVLFIDIDDFKDVNDSLGHEGGDALLVQLAGRLQHCVRNQDLVARLGGDEFAVVVDDGGESAVEIAERILDALRTPFLVNGIRLTVAVSIGIAPRQVETADATELLRNADFAMYMAKGGGKGRYQLFNAHMHHTMAGHLALKTDLALAIARAQLRLDYQPIADLRTGEIVGVEALVRWQHPTLGLLGPADFISLAEETGDIDAIGCWVLDTAARQATAWRRSMEHCGALWVSVNVSPVQLRSRRSRDAMQRILSDANVEAGNIVLEVTESALVADAEGGIASLHELKQQGVRIAIDDFGAGFSALSRLVRFPLDILKIDRSFISGQASGAASVLMLEAILGMADKLSLEVIAEGIERPDQYDLLRGLGCRLGQGFLLSRPVAPNVLEALLASGGLVQLPVAAAL